MADIHPKFQSPSTSLVVQALLTTALLLAVGRFQQLFELAIFAEWLFYMITATTIFYYRRRLPKATTYRVWGYPFLPTLFIVSTAAIVVNQIMAQPIESASGLLFVLLGLPVYYTWARKPTIHDRSSSA